MLYALPAAAPALLVVAAAFSFRSKAAASRLNARISEATGAATAGIALLTLAALIAAGPGTSPLLGAAGFGFASRVDALSVTMLMLVASLGWLVLRYSRTYLDGEAGQGRFLGWMCLTLAAVQTLVQAGNVVMLVAGFIATSLCLHRLLLFYPERFHARRAARKKYVTARLADMALLAAAALLALRYGTGDIAAIAAAASGPNANGPLVYWAAGLIGIAALLKSAQFPAHGWLTEVMETPTPVSALLHAGVINAGGFLLLRFADVLLLAPGVLAVLVLIGGFTAVFGSAVMLTQPAVKTSLAWSTIAQMGFMIFQCGLALFPLALLHIVAHSLYKAHAFLSAGQAVEVVNAIRRPGPIAPPGFRSVGRALSLALAIYLALGFGLNLVGGPVDGFASKSPQAITLGGILVFGVAYLFAQGFADAAPRALTRRTAVYALLASISYFVLQSLSSWALDSTLPAAPAPGPLEWALIVLSLISFAAVAIAQAMFPRWGHHPAARDLRVHLANGLYAKAVFDRIAGGWAARRTPSFYSDPIDP